MRKNKKGEPIFVLNFTYEEIETRVYDIRDLLVPRQDDQTKKEWSDEKKQAFRKQGIEQITQLLTTTIGNPSHWTEQYKDTAFGGTLTELNGNLIIKTTPSNHAQISDLLLSLRSVRGIMVSHEARIMLLDEATFKKAASEAMPGLTLTAQGLRLPQRMEREPFSNLPEGLSGFTLLSDEQAKKLFDLVSKSDGTSLSFASPRMTQFNGTRAYVYHGTETAFVAGYTQLPPDQIGKIGEPIIKIADTGQVWIAESTVTSDREYVTASIELRMAAETGPPIELSVSNGGKQATVDLLQLDQALLKTTVSIPDQSHIVLIGPTIQGKLGDRTDPKDKSSIEDPAGYSDTRRIVMVIKPTILLQSIEDEKFPGLDDAASDEND